MFGYETYYCTRWKTRDHIIPFKVFFVMLRAGESVEAGNQLIQALATAHGVSLVLSGKDHRVKSQTRELIRRANPQRL